MTDLERQWFEAGRRARRQLGLAAPPSFYALLAAALRRRQTSENGAGPTQARRRNIRSDHPDERAIAHEST